MLIQEGEIIEVANATSFALSALVETNDFIQVYRVAESIESAIV